MNTSEIIELEDLDCARQWCIRSLGGEPRRITPLAGGVSNTVLLIDTADERRVVVKQSLPRLKVEAEWLCDRRRILRESSALRLLAPMLPPGAVPTVVGEDPPNCAFAMTAAPESATTWKTLLLGGDSDPHVPERLGQTLAALVRRTADSPSLSHQFGDLEIFDQLRLDAYYRYTASRHPDLAPAFNALIADCVDNRRALVHGDFSPKNVLVAGDSVTIIDWECVHYGNPAFDAAFLLNHLLLKCFHLPDRADRFTGLALVFWRSLDGAIDEQPVMRHLAGLLLARMDGKSPVEYITDSARKDTIRAFARDLFTRPAAAVAEVFDRRSEWR